MTPKECKRLAEVDFPIAVVSKHAVREKSIGHGHPSPEVWNRLGTRILPKLRTGGTLKVGVDLSVTLDAHLARTLEAELRQAVDDLGLSGQVRVERE
ncbi:MAG: hypothetical protein HYY85_17180 [Deltaproteobacteria bacterium]|nr:hypothetical protein [Deltaproteobacteria bacterium]